MSLEPRVRDIYGLPCIGDYEELLQTYTPIWIELDDCQTHHWERFLAVAAQQLGIREQKGLDDPGVDLSLESPDSHQVVVSVLQQLLARGERHAPEVSLDSRMMGWAGDWFVKNHYVTPEYCQKLVQVKYECAKSAAVSD